jgi:hypothetical protein
MGISSYIMWPQNVTYSMMIAADYSDRARKQDYEVRDCDLAAARRVIEQHHYAHGSSHTAVFVHGLYRGDQLVGVAQWLPPTKPCARTVHRQWQKVLSLSRLVVVPGEPKNAASILLGESIRRIKKTKRWVALVTFADDYQGHKGTIYKATNWTYLGQTKPTPLYVDANGKMTARLSTKTRTHKQMLELGCVLLGFFKKHKYIYQLYDSLPEVVGG